MKEVGGPIEYSKEKILKWYSNYMDPGKSSNCYFLIYDEGGTPIGEVSYHGWCFSKKEANLNIKIESKYRGRGYAGDALDSFLKFFFVTAGGEKLIDDLNPKNLGAKYFLEKFGFIEQAGSEDPRVMILKRKVYLEMVQQAAGANTTR